MSTAKTQGIERNHCRQRHWFGRFKRRSIMVSRAKDMVDLTMALCARFRVNGDVSEICTLGMITETLLSVMRWFGHTTVKIGGKGLEPLVEGLRRQVGYYIQAFHVADVEARQAPHWAESMKVERFAEEGVGEWAG